jgi:hypothetical protein
VPGAEPHFVTLAELIRARPPAVAALTGERPAPQTAGLQTAASPIAPPSTPARNGAAESLAGAPEAGVPVRPGAPCDAAEAAREARLFRAVLADAFDALAAELIRALAADVLGRELQLAPVDVALLVRRLVAERRADDPLAVRVCPADADLACELPVVADPELRPGDAVLVCRNGEIDARLAVRLEHVLAAVTR